MGLARLELAAFRFGGECSVHLSYRPKEEAVRLELTTDGAATRIQAVPFIQPDRLQTMRAGFEPASELPETP